MVKRKKDGGFDLRTKEGRRAQESAEILSSHMGGCFLRLILIVIVLVVLSEIFPSFGEWLIRADKWLDQLFGITNSNT